MTKVSKHPTSVSMWSNGWIVMLQVEPGVSPMNSSISKKLKKLLFIHSALGSVTSLLILFSPPGDSYCDLGRVRVLLRLSFDRTRTVSMVTSSLGLAGGASKGENGAW